MTPEPVEPLDLSMLGRVHVVGIGGAGMSGIARILVARGVVVSGSDAKDSRRIAALRALGVDAVVGHDAAHVDGVDTLVEAGHAIDVPVGTAHRCENPGEAPLVFIEVQFGTYFGEDDIVRYEDDYGRAGT